MRVKLNHFAEEVLEACLRVRVLRITQKLVVARQDVLAVLIEARQRFSISILAKRICTVLQEVDCHCCCENVYSVSLISLLLDDLRRQVSRSAHQAHVHSTCTKLSKASHVDELSSHIAVELEHDVV